MPDLPGSLTVRAPVAAPAQGSWFPSYPLEWPAEMLHEAGLVTLDLAEAALEEGMGLKRATPWSISFQATEARFADKTALERRHPNDPFWAPFSQFLKGFVYPLLADRELGVPVHHAYHTSAQGLEAEALYRMLGWSRRLRQPFFSLVSVPTWLRRRWSPGPRRFAGDPGKAKFCVRSLLRSLRGMLARVAPEARRRSPWCGYEAIAGEVYRREKECFLDGFLQAHGSRRLLDLGAGTGWFGVLAASRGVDVVAVDRNPVAVGRLWRRARGGRLPLLPLVMDIARPSPGVGWNNRQGLPFNARSRGAFDTVVAFGPLPHLWVEDGVPPEETVDWFRELGARWVLAEHVGAGDATTSALHRGLGTAVLDRERFEKACLVREFRIARRQLLPGGERCLYLLEHA